LARLDAVKLQQTSKKYLPQRNFTFNPAKGISVTRAHAEDLPWTTQNSPKGK
jgi:hypothetical protein